MTDEEIIANAIIDGWTFAKVLLYDEESIEGYRWNGPRGEEYFSLAKDGSWSNGPEILDQLRSIYSSKELDTKETEQCM